jgi:hypothetical protein
VSYTLIGADGRPYRSEPPGTLGGHRRTKINLPFDRLETVWLPPLDLRVAG